MQTRTIYIAHDGTEFDTQKECLQYETIDSDMPGMMCFDGDINYIDHKEYGAAYAFERSRWVFITDGNEAQRTSEYFSEHYGMVSIPDNATTGDVYEYDENTDEWMNAGEACEKQMACMSGLFGNMLRSCPEEHLDAFKIARNRFINALHVFYEATRIEKEDYDA